jgi:paraquat-inducible protein A
MGLALAAEWLAHSRRLAFHDEPTTESPAAMTGRTTAPSAPAVARVQARPQLLVCSECDALYRRLPLTPGEQARCARCGNLLGRGHRLGRDARLALTLACAVVFLIANLQPMVTVNLRGAAHDTTLLGALWATTAQGAPAVALLAGAAGFAFPLLVIALRLFVLAPGTRSRWPLGWRRAMRGLHFSMRWSMVEVLMLAALVAIVRIAGLAQVHPGAGLFAFGALALLLAALQAAGEHAMWAVTPGSGR